MYVNIQYTSLSSLYLLSSLLNLSSNYFFFLPQSNLNYSLSEIKVEDGYVGKTMNSVSDNLRINTGEAVGVVVRVKDSEKSKIKTISTTLNEILQKKQNYEVGMYVCMYVCDNNIEKYVKYVSGSKALIALIQG